MPRKDLVQIPVVSLEQPYKDLIAGTYMDDFAEWHAKDLVVRESIANAVPSAGVGTCFSRKAILELMVEGTKNPFNTETLTEDYDVGTRLSKAGLTSIIARYPVEYRVKRGAFFGVGPKRVVLFTMPLSVREHFPNTFRASYRQKARWVLGISLQGWAQLGWSRSLATNYFLFRDRKAIATPTLAMIAYYLLINYILLNLYAESFGLGSVEIFSDNLFVRFLLIFNVFALSARILQRMYFVERLYGWGHALLSLIRLFIVSFVNFAATMRALRIYSSSLLTKKTIAWDKTAHRFPTGEWLAQDKRFVGDILIGWEAITPLELDSALKKQAGTSKPLGNILLERGLINDQILAEALATQNNLAVTDVSSQNLEEYSNILKPDLVARLRAVAIGRNGAGYPIIAVPRQLTVDEHSRMRARLGSDYELRIAPEGQLLKAIDRIMGDDPQVRQSLSVPMLHELLIEEGLITKDQVDALLKDYNADRHGSFHGLLIRRKIVDAETIERLGKKQKFRIMKRMENSA